MWRGAVSRGSAVNASTGADQITSTLIAGWVDLCDWDKLPVYGNLTFTVKCNFTVSGPESFRLLMASRFLRRHRWCSLMAGSRVTRQWWMNSLWNTWPRTATHWRTSCSGWKCCCRYEAAPAPDYRYNLGLGPCVEEQNTHRKFCFLNQPFIHWPSSKTNIYYWNTSPSYRSTLQYWGLFSGVLKLVHWKT